MTDISRIQSAIEQLKPYSEHCNFFSFTFSSQSEQVSSSERVSDSDSIAETAVKMESDHSCLSTSQPGGEEQDLVIKLQFDGRFVAGVSPDGTGKLQPEFCDRQEIDVELPSNFPESAPIIHWKTKIFHPNISLDGHVHLADIGLNWDSDMDVVVLCERLWDLARLAYVECSDAANSTAGKWLKNKLDLELPLDHRRFAIGKQMQLNNVFTYRRKNVSDSSKTRKPPVVNAPNSDAIIFID